MELNPGVTARGARSAQIAATVTQTGGVSEDHPGVLGASELAADTVKHAGTRFEVAITPQESIRIEAIDQAIGHPCCHWSPSDSLS